MNYSREALGFGNIGYFRRQEYVNMYLAPVDPFRKKFKSSYEKSDDFAFFKRDSDYPFRSQTGAGR